MRRIAKIVIIGGIIVFTLKLIPYFTSDSVDLLSDAMESMVNIAAIIMMYIALVISERPADEDNHYGHQKAENISAFVKGMLISNRCHSHHRDHGRQDFQPYRTEQSERIVGHLHTGLITKRYHGVRNA